MSRPATASGAAPAKAGTDDECCVCVAVNIRPLIEIEIEQSCRECLLVTPGRLPQVSTIESSSSKGSNAFTYDHVFGGTGRSGTELYATCVKPLVQALFKGYNATVFAYGQSGSGKTYTMGSGKTYGGVARGVIPDVMSEIYARIDAVRAVTECVVRVSFVEINKEELCDLLFADERGPRPEIRIRETSTGVALSGAIEREVKSQEEMAKVLEQGTNARETASTNMNQRSSRSHAVFTITLEQRRVPRMVEQPPPNGNVSANGSPPKEGAESDNEGDVESDKEEEEDGWGEDDFLMAKMHLVDLAGSERAKRTGAEGSILKQGIHINKGLLALGKVISALVDGQGHVPYRDSKLTRLLQDSLGGNSRTVMIACVSPADVNRDETISTLRYADRARHIKNKPVVNRDPAAAALAQARQQLAQARAEILALRKAIGGDANAAQALAAHAATGGGGEALSAAYEELQLSNSRLEVENTRLQMEMDSLREELEATRGELVHTQVDRDRFAMRLQQHKLSDSSPFSSRQFPGGLEHIAEDDVSTADMEVLLAKNREILRLKQELKKYMHVASSVVFRRSSSQNEGSLLSPGAMAGADLVLSPVASSDVDGAVADGPLQEHELHEDAQYMTQVAAHMMEQQKQQLQIAALTRQLEDKSRKLAALQTGSMNPIINQQYQQQLQTLEAERQQGQNDKMMLTKQLQQLHAATEEEKKRLVHDFKAKLAACEERLKDVRRKERECINMHKLKLRTEDMCKRLQDEITRMKQNKVQLQKQMEAAHKQFAAWKMTRERELIQLRRQTQRSAAQLQHWEALHAKQQAVLKRKTQEADAARKRIRDMTELQARAKQDKRDSAAAAAGGAAAGVELQPNSAAPLLRTERARRDWLEQELTLCNQSWDLQRVLEGEIAQRTEASRKLREVQKKLMLADNLQPPSPLVTNKSGVPLLPPLLTPGGRPAAGTKEQLLDKQHELEEEIKARSIQITDLQSSVERARLEEESKGGGAADVRRWNGIRNCIEARELLRTLFKCTSDSKAQLNAYEQIINGLQEELDVRRLQMDHLKQEMEAAKRRAATMEATAATAIAAPFALGAEDVAGGGSDAMDLEADQILQALAEAAATPRAASAPGSSSRKLLSPGRVAKALDFTKHPAATAKPGGSPRSVGATAAASSAAATAAGQPGVSGASAASPLLRSAEALHAKYPVDPYYSISDTNSESFDDVTEHEADEDDANDATWTPSLNGHKPSRPSNGSRGQQRPRVSSSSSQDFQSPRERSRPVGPAAARGSSANAAAAARRSASGPSVHSIKVESYVVDLTESPSPRPDAQQTGKAGSNGAAGAPAAGLSRASSQISQLEHDRRKEWERPALDGINAERAARGQPAVDKLTVKLLKEVLHGHVINGRLFKAGNKTRDQLVLDYLATLSEPPTSSAATLNTSIDKLTGVASWHTPDPQPSGRNSPGFTLRAHMPFADTTNTGGTPRRATTAPATRANSSTAANGPSGSPLHSSSHRDYRTALLSPQLMTAPGSSGRDGGPNGGGGSSRASRLQTAPSSPPVLNFRLEEPDRGGINVRHLNTMQRSWQARCNNDRAEATVRRRVLLSAPAAREGTARMHIPQSVAQSAGPGGSYVGGSSMIENRPTPDLLESHPLASKAQRSGWKR